MYSPRSGSSISSLRTGRPPAESEGRGVGRSLMFVIGRLPSSASVAGSPLVRVEHEPGKGLRVEVGRFLRHDLARLGDRDDVGDRGRLEQERDLGTADTGLDGGPCLRRRFRIPDALTGGRRRRIDAGVALEEPPKDLDVETADRSAGLVRLRLDDPHPVPGEHPETTLAARPPPAAPQLPAEIAGPAPCRRRPRANPPPQSP